MTSASTTKPSHPQMAVLRCCALHRPARAAKVFCVRQGGLPLPGEPFGRLASATRGSPTGRRVASRRRAGMVGSVTLDTVAALREARARTLGLVAHLGASDLERQVDPVMSPLVWDLAHIAAYEDLWLCHRHGGERLLHPELAATYDAFETPRAVRGRIELLDAEGARAYLSAVRERTLDVIERQGVDPVLHELVLRPELQH